MWPAHRTLCTTELYTYIKFAIGIMVGQFIFVITHRTVNLRSWAWAWVAWARVAWVAWIAWVAWAWVASGSQLLLALRRVIVYAVYCFKETMIKLIRQHNIVAPRFLFPLTKWLSHTQTTKYITIFRRHWHVIKGCYCHPYENGVPVPKSPAAMTNCES